MFRNLCIRVKEFADGAQGQFYLRIVGMRSSERHRADRGGKFVVDPVIEISQLIDDITKAASKKAKPIISNVVLMNAGQQTEVAMSIALALQYQLKNALA